MTGSTDAAAPSHPAQDGAAPEPAVRYHRDGALAVVTLNRPKAMNSASLELKEQLLTALRTAAGDGEVRAVLLTGAGRAFCAGQDLREHMETVTAGGSVQDTVRAHFNPIISTITGMPKPVVAAVNGVAAGAGASIAYACDLRVAARSASFLMAFARVGLGADSGASWTLPRLVGGGRATELLMLAEPVGAEAALAMGMVNQVVDDDQLMTTATALAQRLAEGPTAAYAAIKTQLAAAAAGPLVDALEVEAVEQAKAGRTADHLSACESFLAKKPAVFTGH